MTPASTNTSAPHLTPTSRIHGAKGQVMTLEAVMALFIAMLFVYLMLGTGTGPKWDTRLERAGYDTLNAVYADNELYSALVGGAERNYYSAAETSTINARLARYVRILNIGKVELKLEGAQAFTGRNENLPDPLNKETFYALLPLRQGEDMRLLTITVWV